MTSTQAPSIPPRADGLAIAAILFALFCVLAAFGALHLSGTDGVLALLERRGFTLERLDL